METDYKQKYLKYKAKYLQMKYEMEGGNINDLEGAGLRDWWNRIRGRTGSQMVPPANTKVLHDAQQNAQQKLATEKEQLESLFRLIRETHDVVYSYLDNKLYLHLQFQPSFDMTPFTRYHASIKHNGNHIFSIDVTNKSITFNTNLLVDKLKHLYGTSIKINIEHQAIPESGPTEEYDQDGYKITVYSKNIIIYLPPGLNTTINQLVESTTIPFGSNVNQSKNTPNRQKILQDEIMKMRMNKNLGLDKPARPFNTRPS